MACPACSLSHLLNRIICTDNFNVTLTSFLAFLWYRTIFLLSDVILKVVCIFLKEHKFLCFAHISGEGMAGPT